MKKLKSIKHEKEFDTQTLFEDINKLSTNNDKKQVTGDTTPVNIRKEKSEHISDQTAHNSENKITKIYEPRPLTPDDDIYDDIIEQFASAPTKPKYWFEEFGDYWSCSCGHINKGTHCKNCGLERELLRSLFILHKPADAPGKLNKKLKKAKEQVDKEELQQAEKEKKRKKLEELQGDNPKVVPIENSDYCEDDINTEINDTEEQNTLAVKLESESAADNLSGNTADSEITSESESHMDYSSDTDSNTDATASSEDSKNSISSVSDSDKTDADDKNNSESTALSIIQKNKIIKPVKRLRKQTKILLIAIISVILIGAASAAGYMYFAAPALQYEEALQLQADGKYEQAIKKYEALGDYKDSKNMIWECYIGIGDNYFQDSDFEKAIDTYNIALKEKESKELYTKIWKCYIGIADRYFDQKDYEKALEAYYTAIDQKDSKELQDKVNKTKMAYVETYKGDRTSKVEQFMSELKAIKYPGIDKIYDAYYAWHVKITANTSEEDYSTDISTASRKDTIYFHMILSGGEPSEQIQLYYEVIWPNGSSQIYGLDSNWKTGSKITARFQYPVPLFGKEGNLTFKLYDKSTNEELGSDSVTLQK